MAIPPDQALALLAQVRLLAANMRRAAEARDWELLASLHEQRAAPETQLRECAVTSGPLGNDAACAALIREILADDDYVMNEARSGMAEAAQVLAAASRERSLRSAYGVAP